ncbi:MAG: hypothetical protein JSV86_00210 [Gemmatimonadota bacterium]|nr:MAG: hypothetical protein JSV86_00210 [Gemmatimonadota bacterium]
MTKELDPNWHKRLKRPIQICSDDKTTCERARGLIAAGWVKPVRGLTLGQRNQGAALVNVLLTEAAEEAKVERTLAELSRQNAEKAERRSKPEPPGPPSAQELFDRMVAADNSPKPTQPVVPREPSPGIPQSERRLATAEELRNPPKTIKRTDLLGIGKWSEAIAVGKTRLVD